MGEPLEIRRRAPAPGSADLRECLKELASAPCGEPFSADVLYFFSELSRRIFASDAARTWPEMLALAFFTRKASLLRLQAEFQAQASRRAPRGTTFHVPPGNVDTMFLYSWLLSALVGNRNVVRLSPRRSVVTDLILQHLNDALAEDASGLAQRTLMVEYQHEAEITAACSAACDVRVLWGGDETVRTLRAIALPPRAIELTFPDRLSYAVLDSRTIAGLPEDGLMSLAEKLFNDTYWFDQRGCSSPRALLFCGDDSVSSSASGRLLAALATVIVRKGYRASTDLALRKRLYAHQLIIDEGADRLRWMSNELVTIRVPTLVAVRRREHCGGGLFLVVRLEQLAELTPFISSQDQTLTHFGFDSAAILAFARSVQGRGLDRIVPLGKALEFSHLWDGYDLLQSFTRAVDIQLNG